MTVQAKICGINSAAAMAAAVEGGAAFVGLVFYAPSPRYVTPEEAAELAASVPEGVIRTGLYVDAEDAVFEATAGPAGLGLLQLHGSESPDRVRALKATFGLPVMKAVKIAGPEDLAGAEPYIGVADRLLFDAKPPKEMVGALPGGNALAFDWELIAGRDWHCPWMLSGGLTAENLAEAVRITGAVAVDVSSGVEDAPGQKNPDKIRAFLAAAAQL
ncbi:MAG: phosphoribosylanthranilate isomerase [Alphaproteobacteria bacterium]|nr:phosphoribosylanthranilate isomerase [Alphaproteobacteria bacterium]